MKNSFWGLLWLSFLEIQGVLVGVLGVVISILAWVFSSKTQISLALAITIAVFTLIVIITLFQAAYKAFRQMKKLESEAEILRRDNQDLAIQRNKRLVSKILQIRPIQTVKGLQILYLLEPSELFANEMYISFYYTDDDGFEILIGVGTVNNIQTDGKIQAFIDHPIPDHQDIVNRLENNDAKVKDKTVIRPNISKKVLNDLQNKP